MALIGTELPTESGPSPWRERNRFTSGGARVLYRVQRPDRATNFGEKFGRVVDLTQSDGVDEDHLARERLEGGAEMLHRFDRNRCVAGRINAERGELAEIGRLPVVGDHDD